MSGRSLIVEALINPTFDLRCRVELLIAWNDPLPVLQLGEDTLDAEVYVVFIHARLVRSHSQVCALALSELTDEILGRITLDCDGAAEAIMLVDYLVSDDGATPSTAINFNNLLLTIVSNLERVEARKIVLTRCTDTDVDARVDH